MSPVFSIAYTAPTLLEVSTRGKVNIKVSDDPLYNLVIKQQKKVGLKYLFSFSRFTSSI